MKIKDKFAVFILTYGRSEKVKTIDSLRKGGYTGEIYLICSTDDKELPTYQKLHKNVIVFDKKDYKGKFDIADNFSKDNVVVYARNANFDIAEKLGYTYFMQLDDDYTDFRYKFNDKSIYGDTIINKGLDQLFEYCLNYYKSIPNCKALAFAQGGDFIGGWKGSQAEKIQIKRKIMNVYFFSTKRRVQFVGRINEDTNTYVHFGNRGDLMFQINNLAINQPVTQTNFGGLTEFYLDGGTYLKSFYTVIFSPSCTKIALMGSVNQRLHHKVSWNNAVPKIISESYKK